MLLCILNFERGYKPQGTWQKKKAKKPMARQLTCYGEKVANQSHWKKSGGGSQGPWRTLMIEYIVSKCDEC